MISEDLVAAASFTPDLLQSPSAWLGHLPFAGWVVRETKPKIFVELGTHYGHSYFSFCQSVLEAGISSKCYAVDTWQGDEHAGEYSDQIFAKVNAHHQEHYAEFSRLLRMTFDDAVSYFADESIELLHIDGLHTYEAVRHDFETWLPKLAPGAVVMFHDTNVRERNFGVWKLWEELQARYPNNLEFVHSHGLGVLQLNNATEANKLEWLQPKSPEKRGLINYFAALGSRQLERFGLAELSGEVSKLNKSIGERDEKLGAYHHAVLGRDEQIASLIQLVSERDGQIVRLAREVDALRNSTSWHLTKPVRFVGHQFARVKHLVKIAPHAFRVGGGAGPALKKALGLYRREGLAGVKRGIRFVQTGGVTKPALGSESFDRNDYAEWVRRFDTMDEAKRAKLRALCEGLASKPMISVVMPTYNPRPEWLVEAIESVRGQIYPHWELCIADDASPDPTIRSILERYAREDGRIKVVFREHNGHISAASNSALELATGGWIALLDHDDLLPEHALALLANAINLHPHAGLIYSDEDKIDEQGNRSTPYFKCEFNIDLFRSQNMICHLGAYRSDLVKQLLGFRLGFEGAQDYDLALRVVEQLDPQQIVHIPHVLYHWRMHSQSTALCSGAKSYAQDSGLKALTEHLQRRAINAKVELTPFLQYRIRYEIPNPLPKVSLIIPTRNGLHVIRQCIESILNKTTYKNYEILVIDNGSDDPEALNYFASFRGTAKVRVIRDDSPFNYSALNNRAVTQSDGEFVGLLNNDIEVITPEWLDEMLSLAAQPGNGAVGACLWYPNETLQHGGVIVGLGGVAGHSHKYLPRGAGGFISRARLTQGVSAVTAACLVIKKSIFLEVGGLNEVDLQVAFNDVDFCLKVREAGYKNVWTPFAELYHHESATRGVEDTPEKRTRFAREVLYMKTTWSDSLLDDPSYSPNLTLDYEDFSLAWPPRVELV